MNKRSKLFFYQSEGSQALLTRRKLILADYTGLGKTVQVADALRQLKVKTLVVCPRKLDHHWAEILTRDYPDIEGFLPKNKAQRIDCYLHEGPSVTIISYENLVSDWVEINKGNWQVYVFDEAHHLCNPDSRRHRVVAQYLNEVPYRFLLTATPIMNKGRDLFFVLKCASRDYPQQLGRRMGIYDATPEQLDLVIHHLAPVRVAEALEPFLLRRSADDESRRRILPEVQYFIIDGEMTEPQRAYYDQEKKKPLRMKYQNVLARLTALRQIANDPALVGGGSDSWKYDLIDELSCERDTVIFTEFKRFADRLADYLGSEGHDVHQIDGSRNTAQTKEAKEQFHARGGVMICTRAGEEGHDLQRGQRIIHADLPYNPSRLEQRNGRIARIGQKSPEVDVYYLLTENSVEERIADIIYGKEKLIEGILDPITKKVTLEVAKQIFGY